jgi:hypothetical protein
MLSTNHPDDERLSALAAADADATDDAALVAHVAACASCTAMVDDLGLLRATLADLPDLHPHRPLRLVPEADAAPDRIGGWMRKAFGPAMAAGAALALIGMVGTTAPLLNGMASGGGAAQEAAASDVRLTAQSAAAQPGAGGVEGFYSPETDGETRSVDGAGAEAPDTAGEPNSQVTADPALAERSIWPMVLFTGIALLIATALLRWILVPRAG